MFRHLSGTRRKHYPPTNQTKRMMRKLFILTALCAPMLLSAHVNVTVTPESQLPNGTPLRAFGQYTCDEIVAEDFNALEKGTEATPFLDYDLSKFNNGFIDPDLMHGQQWQAYKAYSAGGAMCLRTTNPQDGSYLLTPRNDYSGTVTMSFRLKYHEVKFVPDEEKGDTARWAGGGVQLMLCNDRGSKFDIDPDLKNANFGSYCLLTVVRVYEDQGWCRVTVQFDNYSTYNDSYIQFACSDGVLIDDINIDSSSDQILGQPVMIGVKDVTDTSFTMEFEPTRKAYNYYAYLYTLKGYDDEGEPIYIPHFDPEMKATLDMMGITEEEYAEMLREDPEGENYCNYAMVDDRYAKEVTFTGLDPNEQYYYAVAAHNVLNFSKKVVYRMDEMPMTVANEATDITTNGFTANWNPTVRGTGYEVDLYGVYPVKEDTEDFVIFQEDFSKVKNFTDAKNEWDAEVLGENNAITLDDLSTTPGWTGNKNHITMAGDMLGVDEKGFNLTSPVVYCAGSDKVKFRVRLVSTTDSWQTYIKFADQNYVLSSSDFVDEEEFELPTNGLTETTFKIWGPENYPLMIDYITMMQDLKAGDNAFVWMGSTDINKDNSSLTFTDLDTDLFDNYGYAVKTINGEGTSAKRSVGSNRVVVNLQGSPSQAAVGVELTDKSTQAYQTNRYAIDGQLIAAPAKGINIVKYSDGTVKKVIVK